ncbi:MAG: transporter [Terriglobales bacterium]
MKSTVFSLLCALILLCAADRAESARPDSEAIDAHVVSKQGAAPIHDASVTVMGVSGPGSDVCSTDKDGYCRLDHAPTGKCSVRVTADGFEPLEKEGNLEQLLSHPLALEPLQTLASKASPGAYIDSAIIGSQIRVRFEAAFHENAPDRAEFFYARYAGLNNGPGPNSVVADLNFQQLYLQAEYAARKRLSVFAEVPLRSIQPQLTVANTNNDPRPSNVNTAGLSDLAAGFKLAAVASSNQYLTFQFQAYFPSGDASKGLGTNHYSVEPAVLYYRRLSDRVALEAEVGDSHPIGGSFCQSCITNSSISPPAPPPVSGGFAGDVFFYGVGPSYVLYRGEHVRIAPVIELVGWRVLGGIETICVPGTDMDTHKFNPCLNQEGASADGTNIVNLKAGVRTSIGRHSSFYVGFGHAVTRSHWYEEIVRAEYRYSF